VPPEVPARASPQPALSAGLPAPVEPDRPEVPVPPTSAVAKAPEAARETGAPEGETMGTVRLPARAAGHRIFVDGRRAKTQAEPSDDEPADGVAPLRLRCGSHVVQIGSGGTPERIDLPCGGEVQLE
jgi:hypothetical protein